MAKKKTVFLCTECGFDAPKWSGKCPQCGQWNTMVEETVVSAPEGSFGARAVSAGQGGVPTPLDDIRADEGERTQTGIAELDRVLGGGMVQGSLVLVSGEPGIGKSTLLLQASDKLCRSGTVLYVTGEESLSQIKLRAARLGIGGRALLICAETELTSVLSTAERLLPSVIVIDSIQTMYDAQVSSVPGSVSQVRECTMRLMQFAKMRGVSVILVGHVNKDGAIAGPKVLEHMVDTVLTFEGEQHATYRMLRATKNRFGSTNEMGLFEMTGEGLVDVPNPSAALLSGRPEGASGSCVVAVLEGTRPILAEVQGLVTKSAYGASRRTSAGIDYNRAVLLLAILEKRAGLMLGAYDTYINVVGGLLLDEPAADLAVAMAVASSYLEKPIAGDVAVFGEIGLSGELRSVAGAAQRISELRRLGFGKCILPKACMAGLKGTAGIELLPVSDVREAIRMGFGT